MGWTQVIADSLRLPPDGSVPAIDLNPDVPAVLNALNPGNIVIEAVVLWYYNATDFYWQGIGTFFGQTTYFEGTYDTVNDVLINYRIEGPSAATLIKFGMGAAFQPTHLSANFNNCDVALDSDSKLTTTGVLVTPSNQLRVGVPSGLISTNSASFVSLSVPAAFTFSKLYDDADSQLLVTFNGSCFFANTATGVEFGVNVNDGSTNTDTIIAKLAQAVLINTSQAVCGMNVVTGFDAGSLTITLRWRRTGAANDVHVDAGHRLCLRVEEVHK